MNDIGKKQLIVRTKPFEPSIMSGDREKELLIRCFESLNWSSFKGATEGRDITDVGSMSSSRAASEGALENRFLGGKYIREFEALVAEKFGSKFCVSANSATSCLVMAFGSLNIGPGDEVLVPCMSFNATATAILAYNAIPVFCEVKPGTFCIDPKDIVRKITPKTKAILAVHLAGNGADMDSITDLARRYNLAVIEDAAQAPAVKYKGKTLGTIGDVGVFSLTETKNITCGEGGFLLTDNVDIAMKARLIRNHGEGVAEENWDDEQLINVIGMNFRLTELQAAVAIPQFEELEWRNQQRRELTDYLLKELEQFNDILVPPEIESGVDFACYILKWRWQGDDIGMTRDRFVENLRAEGIPVTSGYGRLMHENPIFTRRIAYNHGCPFTCPYTGESKPQYGTGALPVSEQVNRQFIWFKYINPPNTISDMNDVIEAIKKCLKAYYK